MFLPAYWMLMSAYLFSPATTTEKGLTLEIGEIGPVTALEQEIPVPVTLSAEGARGAEISAQVEIAVIDRWRVVGDAVKTVSIAPGERKSLRFAVVAGRGTYAAHYPIHATATIATPSGEQTLHTVLVVEVTPQALETAPTEPTEPTGLVLRAPGRLGLLDLASARLSFRTGGDVTTLPSRWSGTETRTGTTFQIQEVNRGDRRAALAVHPPWRTGWGTAYADWIVQLPDETPILLDFATAIRDNDPDTEPPSDGVQFEVRVAPEGADDATLETRFERFSDAKRWENARVDLSDYAGQRIRLRLVTDPGPAHDTTCDLAYWADPVLLAGIQPPTGETSDDARAARVAQATKRAQRALDDGTDGEDAWRLSDDSAVALDAGALGIVDAALAFASPIGTIAFDGFRVEIDGRRVGDWRSGFAYGSVRHEGDTWTLPVQDGNRSYDVTARVRHEGGGLRLRFAITGIEPDTQGHPRFTRIALGPVDRSVRRLYAGHGNVLEEPGRLRLRYDGFNLSTSFVGFDFTNGVSLVQATDIPPDRIVVDPDVRIATLEASHNVTWTFVPSTKGAFDAARRYRKIANPPAAPSLDRLLGRMALDQWGGDYARAAEDLERAARYGMTDSVFVKHDWQRWGYDYRLPEIYPPAGSWRDFQAMANAAKRHGILFAPHDNYIDFYPDAKGFSYGNIIFNADGTPQRAWYNAGRDAQSYRWLPHAFRPWMEENLRLIREGIAPTSYFIDVFSAIPPMDYFDESGRFYPKTRTIREWAAAFDRVREAFDGAPMISEAGHDALVGHLEAAEADHMGWVPPDRPGRWAWRVPAKDGERVPWQDMVTHGRFILLAGGLGPRYAGAGSRELHGYGSDDYLTMTVLGGRSPMSDGPFNRTAVMTYWLLHDLNAELARREMVEHRFAGDDIHRQIVRFGDDARVVVNRGDEDWAVESAVLPPYGFIAEAGSERAGIVRIDGVISAYAFGPEAIFVDARPPEQFGGLPIRVEIVGVEALGGRRFRLHMRWKVAHPISETGRAYLHFTNAEVAPNQGEQIAFYPDGLPITSDQWTNAGSYDVFVEATLPEGMPLSAYGIRYGIYQPNRGGRRLRLQGPRDATGRHDGGTLLFSTQPDGSLSVRYEPPPEDGISERVNVARRALDFGPIRTNGALRYLRKDRLIIPLPGSQPFDVQLDLAALGLPETVRRVVALDENRAPIRDVAFQTEAGTLRFRTEAEPFAYRIEP